MSAYDDGTLSATPTGIYQTLQTPYLTTVGIVPSTTDQQLLFFLYASTAQLGAANGYYRMNIMYNPSVVQYSLGNGVQGVDFAAYYSSFSNWAIDTFPCYTGATKYCTWYNKTQEFQVNSVVNTLNSQSSNPYAFVRFECGTATLNTAVPVATCNNFQGQSYTDGYSGVIAMRKVVFESGFRSSLYPD